VPFVGGALFRPSAVGGTLLDVCSDAMASKVVVVLTLDVIIL
jgi:hypothetical protein